MTGRETEGGDNADLRDAKRFSVNNFAIADSPRLGVRGWLRWSWRQVTSMRLSLILLLLLGLAAIPGSILPQSPQNPAAARAYVADNPVWGPIANALGLLDVFGSAWFTAIYLLLFASLVGCIVPRSIAHGRAMRLEVAAAPSALKRYEPIEEVVALPMEQAAALAAAALRPRASWWGAVRGYRVRIDTRGKGLALAAEKGHMREFGNLLFHLSLVGVLLAMAFGSMFTYRGQAIIVEADSFTNAVADYDTYEAGALFDPASLEPFTLRFDALDAAFYDDARPESFTAHVTVTEPGRTPRAGQIEVNRPITVAGGKIYLMGNGYAPHLTVEDADGSVAFAGAVPFLAQDAVYTSTGVVKVPDVTSGPQLGIKATLLPTAVETPVAGIVSVWPELVDPAIYFTVYEGDLALDDGVPQNIYQLDESQLSPVRGDDGQPAVLVIRPGETVELPDGLGSVTWSATPRYIGVDLRADPSLPWLLLAAVGAFVGITVSLFGSRRRVWLLLTPVAGSGESTLVQGAVLAPAHDQSARRERDRAMAAVAGREAPGRSGQHEEEQWN